MAISVYRNEPEPPRITGNDYVRWFDVRLPITIEEGEASLTLIATKISALERELLLVPGRSQVVTYAAQKWKDRHAEIEWMVERMRAGESAPSMDLARERAAHAETAKKLDAARLQAKSLESKVTTLVSYRHTEASESKLGGLRMEIASLRGAIQDRNATIESLRSAPATIAAHTAAAAVKAEHRRDVDRMHEVSSEALEAMDSMTAAGATHTSMSHLVWTKLNSCLPGGFRARWRAVHLPRLADAAAALTAAEAL